MYWNIEMWFNDLFFCTFTKKMFNNFGNSKITLSVLLFCFGHCECESFSLIYEKQKTMFFCLVSHFSFYLWNNLILFEYSNTLEIFDIVFDYKTKWTKSKRFAFKVPFLLLLIQDSNRWKHCKSMKSTLFMSVSEGMNKILTNASMWYLENKNLI